MPRTSDEVHRLIDKVPNSRDLAGEALVLKTMALGHSLECAWKAVFPSTAEMAEAPKCLDDLPIATLREQYSAPQFVLTAGRVVAAHAA